MGKCGPLQQSLPTAHCPLPTAHCPLVSWGATNGRGIVFDMFGVLNINKPAGPTSRDIVNRVQRLVRPAKAGHAGTLDPIASGVLLVCVGQATRLIEYAQRLPKSYRALFHLGRRSASDDVEGEVEVVEGARQPTAGEIETALTSFTGEILQRPPLHSAVKIGGRRAYELARQGVDFETAAKPVVIHRLRVVRYEYPEIVLDVDCGSGTYIRSLGRDLATELRTWAVMAELERTAIGEFTLEMAVTPDVLGDDWRQHLISPARLLASLPLLSVSDIELQELQHGRAIRRDGICGRAPESGEVAAFDERGELVAILAERRSGEWRPVRNFTQPA
jgi:tRNA pseudouridine55 synthase